MNRSVAVPSPSSSREGPRRSTTNAFLLHSDCVQILHNISNTIPMRAIWIFCRCIQPKFLSCKPGYSTRWMAGALDDSSTRELLPKSVSMTLNYVSELPVELQIIILELSGPGTFIAMLSVVLGVLPVLLSKQLYEFCLRDTELDCSQAIYAEYITLRGQTYISNLSNKHDHGMSKVPTQAAPRILAMSMDSFGIRRVSRVQEARDSRLLGDLWYRFEILPQKSGSMITLRRNPLVIDDVILDRHNHRRFLWDSPMKPEIIPHQWYDPSPENSDCYGFKRVSLNGSVSGIAVSCGQGTNMSFHAIREGQRDASIHVKTEVAAKQPLTWIYFPLAEGETICGVWVMTNYGGLANVCVYTTLGRSRIFASFKEPWYRCGDRYQCINSGADGSITALYYDSLRLRSERSLRVGVVSSHDDVFDVPENPPWADCPIPEVCLQTDPEWFHSQASLRDVVSAETCEDGLTGVCLGVLLRYRNGREETLGQWRFDQTVATFEHDPCIRSMSYRIDRSKGKPRMRAVSFGACLADESSEGVSIQMQGHLIWWFSDYGGGFVVHLSDTGRD
ncbi:hypothetical protein BU24DRAFT_404770 [Aaosphaeria arxii CBS 175.79]|uniref:Uncharacterized protein n=1 Tax=Aaosphaeria arxii CBS 175.79 TaxID=1450172 RepID=A0A6A5Y9A7_9PLEO|nr:uncharacterized protein BU24DRAFT_404770 [Aaosphaeria arxii CBS 175.79]KAF2021813.1 hypothetical protein BU24DRAFT_404770 [Aaosphaeria arxii CBS 175.79]